MMEDLMRRLREGKVRREELESLRDELERRAKELEREGKCEEAGNVQFMLRLIENLLKREGS